MGSVGFRVDLGFPWVEVGVCLVGLKVELGLAWEVVGVG